MAALALRFCLTLCILATDFTGGAGDCVRECFGGRPRFLRGGPCRADVALCRRRFAMRLGGRVNFILREGAGAGGGGGGCFVESCERDCIRQVHWPSQTGHMSVSSSSSTTV